MQENKEPFDQELMMPTEFLLGEDDLNYMMPYQRNLNSSSVSQQPQQSAPKKTKTIKRGNGAKQKKIDMMSRRIHQLEKEIQILKGKNFCERCKCQLGRHQHPAPNIPTVICSQQTKQYAKPQPSQTQLQFQQFCITTPQPEPQQQLNLSGQIWILMGLLMMLMGININGYDGTIDVYKVTKQTVDYLRKQVEKSAETIVLPVFFSKVFGLEGSLGVSNQVINEGFELEGLRLESISEGELMFEEHLNLNLKYEALIVMMEYMKQYASIK